MNSLNSITGFNTNGGIHEVPVPGVDGRMWLCGKHFIAPNVHDVRTSTDNATVVCLVERFELEDRYPDYLTWLDSAPDHGNAIWYPIHDMHAPHIDNAIEFYGQLADSLRTGQNLVVHCAAGIGRAGTTAAGVLMTLGATHDEALNTVAQSRPMAGPQTREQELFMQAVSLRLQR
jgi:protein-tyrosine phosphatase